MTGWTTTPTPTWRCGFIVRPPTPWTPDTSRPPRPGDPGIRGRTDHWDEVSRRIRAVPLCRVRPRCHQPVRGIRRPTGVGLERTARTLATFMPDRILEAENDSVNRYKASKQADVLMLFYLLSADEVAGVVRAHGISVHPEQTPATVDYVHRTSHGSTSSGVVHAWVLARQPARNRAMRFTSSRCWCPMSSTSGRHHGGKAFTSPRWPAASICCSAASPPGDPRRSADHQSMFPKGLGALRMPIYYRGYRMHLTTEGRKRQARRRPGRSPPVGDRVPQPVGDASRPARRYGSAEASPVTPRDRPSDQQRIGTDHSATSDSGRRGVTGNGSASTGVHPTRTSICGNPL